MEKNNSAATFRQVLKNRQFFALWLAQFVSNFGDWLALLALFSLVAFRWHGTPYQVAGIFISFTIPWAFLGPIAGVFVDRWNLKWTMIASDLIRAALVALLPFTTDLHQLYPLLFALSAVSCFFMPAQTAAIPLLVRREELLVANAANAQTVQFNKIVSPAIAGLLVAWAGEKVCFYLDSLSFLLSAGLLSFLAMARRPAAAAKGISSILEELRAGLSFLWKQRTIRFVILAMVAAIFAVGAFDALIAVFVRDILHATSQVFGSLVAVVGVGTIIGALLIGKFGQTQTRVSLVVLGIFSLGLGVFLLALSSHVGPALLCSFFLGVAASSVLVPSQTLMQEETPQGILGRVSSTAAALMTVAQLASVAIAGKIADRIGIRNVYFLVALLLVLTASFGYGYARVNRLAAAKAPSIQT